MDETEPPHLFHSKVETGVDVSSSVNFTVGALLYELLEDKLPSLLVFRVHGLDFLMEKGGEQLGLVT